MKRDQVIFTWDPYTNPIIADVEGTIRFVDIVEDESVSEELDELTGLRQRVIIEDREKKLHPHIEIWQAKGGKEKESATSSSRWARSSRSRTARRSSPATRSRRSAAKRTRRATSRAVCRASRSCSRRARPKDPATISEIDGVVRFGDIKRGKREIFVHPIKRHGRRRSTRRSEAQLYEVAAGKHLRVHEGDRVRAGDRLSEGPVNPHDILRIKGPRAVQEYLLNEVQEVYRLQGVKINDKHIGVIVRQMLQKVRVMEPGETEFLEGEHVDKQVFRDENDRAKKKKETPATAEPLLLGITKARSRRSRSSRRRRSRRPRASSPTRRSAARRTTCSASRRTSSSVTSFRPARVCTGTRTSRWKGWRCRTASRAAAAAGDAAERLRDGGRRRVPGVGAGRSKEGVSFC